MVDPIVYIYRKAQFSYEDGAVLRVPSNLCGCPCNTSKCTGIDALFASEALTLPTLVDDEACETVHDQYEKVAQMMQNITKRTPPKNHCHQPSVRNVCPIKCTPGINTKIAELLQAQSKLNPSCEVCTDIRNVLNLALDNDFKQPFIGSSTTTYESLQAGADAYKQAKAKGEASIQQAIAALEQKRVHFEAQAAKIRALKDKVRVATEVLHEATGKLSGMGTSFNTLEQQNGLQYKDRVPVGIPYLPPFFTLSNRNFVVMMVCINVLLLVGIIVYAFVGRIRTDADVVATRGVKDTGEGDSTASAPAPAPTTAPAPAPAPEPTPAPPVESSSSSSSMFADEPAASSSSETATDSLSASSSDDASTGRARGGRPRSSLSAGRRYAD